MTSASLAMRLASLLVVLSMALPAHADSRNEGPPRLPVRTAEGVGYIDLTGAVVIAPRFEDGRLFREGLAAVKAGGRWGFIDPAGVWRVQPVYDEVQDYSEGRAAVLLGRGWGYIDARGLLLVAAVLQGAQPFRRGRASVGFAGNEWCIDRMGRPVPPKAAQGASSPNGRCEGPPAPKQEPTTGLWGFVDAAGGWVIAPRFLEVHAQHEPHELLATARVDSGWGLLDWHGDWRVAPGCGSPWQVRDEVASCELTREYFTEDQYRTTNRYLEWRTGAELAAGSYSRGEVAYGFAWGSAGWTSARGEVIWKRVGAWGQPTSTAWRAFDASWERRRDDPSATMSIEGFGPGREPTAAAVRAAARGEQEGALSREQRFAEAVAPRLPRLVTVGAVAVGVMEAGYRQPDLEDRLTVAWELVGPAGDPVSSGIEGLGGGATPWNVPVGNAAGDATLRLRVMDGDRVLREDVASLRVEVDAEARASVLVARHNAGWDWGAPSLDQAVAGPALGLRRLLSPQPLEPMPLGDHLARLERASAAMAAGQDPLSILGSFTWNLPGRPGGGMSVRLPETLGARRVPLVVALTEVSGRLAHPTLRREVARRGWVLVLVAGESGLHDATFWKQVESLAAHVPIDPRQVLFLSAGATVHRLLASPMPEGKRILASVEVVVPEEGRRTFTFRDVPTLGLVGALEPQSVHEAATGLCSLMVPGRGGACRVVTVPRVDRWLVVREALPEIFGFYERALRR